MVPQRRDRDRAGEEPQQAGQVGPGGVAVEGERDPQRRLLARRLGLAERGRERPDLAGVQRVDVPDDQQAGAVQELVAGSPEPVVVQRRLVGVEHVARRGRIAPLVDGAGERELARPDLALDVSHSPRS